MIEAIKPNSEDKFDVESMELCRYKIKYRDSEVTIQIIDESNFEVKENKCKKFYDLRKIHGYILYEMLK